MNTVTLTNQELAIILTALRTYEEAVYGEPSNRPDRIHMIATNAAEEGEDGELSSLDDEGIDSLCARLNLA